MQPDLDIAVLAVDGGGTNCRLALEAGGERHTVLLGPANVSTDMDLAATTIRNGLERMATECGVDYAALCRVPAYLGLAGVVDAEYGARFGEELPLERVVVDDDRRPAVGDLRANMVRGGAARPTDLSKHELAICDAIGPTLRERGLLLVGIDVIHGKLTEINVTAPTGVRAIKKLGGPDLAAQLWDVIESKR